MQWNFQDGKARNEFVIKSREHCLQLVVPGEHAVYDQVERAHGGHGPEEVVEVALVEVVGDPPGAIGLHREPHYDGLDEGAEVAAQRDGEQRQRRAGALHGVWRLDVEELQLCDVLG